VPIKGADKGGDDAEIEARFADSMVLYKYALARSQLLSLMERRGLFELLLLLLIGSSRAGSRRVRAVRRWT
jgi:hypothetical protein